jgi:hypothetical protein
MKWSNKMDRKKIKYLLLLAFLLCMTMGEEALALPSYTVGNTIDFAYTGGQIQVGFYPGQVNSASGGAGDPIVGAWQTLYGPSHTSWDYILVSQILPGVWSLDSDAEKIVLTTNVGDYGTPSQYLISGWATAQTIDFNTGTLTWGPVTGLTTQNLIGSSTLTDFAGYSTGSLTMSFITDTALRNWVQAPTATAQDRSYSATLTGVPEPATWVLMMAGLGLMGYTLYRRQDAIAR